MDDRILQALRLTAWERAKGELHSLLHTYWDEDEEYEKAEVLISRFVSRMEDEGGMG